MFGIDATRGILGSSWSLRSDGLVAEKRCEKCGGSFNVEFTLLETIAEDPPKFAGDCPHCRNGFTIELSMQDHAELVREGVDRGLFNAPEWVFAGRSKDDTLSSPVPPWARRIASALNRLPGIRVQGAHAGSEFRIWMAVDPSARGLLLLSRLTCDRYYGYSKTGETVWHLVVDHSDVDPFNRNAIGAVGYVLVGKALHPDDCLGEPDLSDLYSPKPVSMLASNIEQHIERRTDSYNILHDAHDNDDNGESVINGQQATGPVHSLDWLASGSKEDAPEELNEEVFPSYMDRRNDEQYWNMQPGWLQRLRKAILRIGGYTPLSFSKNYDRDLLHIEFEPNCSPVLSRVTWNKSYSYVKPQFGHLEPIFVITLANVSGGYKCARYPDDTSPHVRTLIFKNNLDPDVYENPEGFSECVPAELLAQRINDLCDERDKSLRAETSPPND